MACLKGAEENVIKLLEIDSVKENGRLNQQGFLD